jgi:putative ABC transport system permease protein
MLRLIYLYKNLTRNMLRTILTCAAVALPIMIYVLSTSVIDGIQGFLDNSAKQLRLAVTHRASVMSPLPAGYRAKIESLDPTRTRLLSVCGMRWIGGKIENDPRPLSTLAVDHDTFPATFPDHRFTPQEIELWNRDRQALSLGPSTAGEFGWKVGDRLVIQASVPPYTPLEFHVICASEYPNKDPVTNFCRLDYIDEALALPDAPEGWRAKGWVSFFFVKCATQADLHYFRAAIDDLFANSPDPTKTQDEKTFMSEFINQLFNLPRNLTILAVVTIFVAIMAAANTMSMNLRDRMSEVAVFKSVGFPAAQIFAIVQIESLILCLLGGMVGAAAPYFAFNHTPLKDFTVPLIQHLDVQWWVCAKSLVIAFAVGVVAAAWPAIVAARTTVIAALRTLE